MKTTLRLELPALTSLHADSRVAFALLDRQHAVQRTGELPLADLAAARVAAQPDAIAVVYEGRRWTYAETLATAENVGRSLLVDGAPGDRVLVFGSFHTAAAAIRTLRSGR
mgnify:CR=1 FL=1